MKTEKKQSPAGTNIYAFRQDPHTSINTPCLVLFHRQLTQGAKNLYAVLKSYNFKGFIIPAKETLAAALEVSARQIYNYLQQLVSAGLIWVEHRPGRASRYYLLDLATASSDQVEQQPAQPAEPTSADPFAQVQERDDQRRQPATNPTERASRPKITRTRPGRTRPQPDQARSEARANPFIQELQRDGQHTQPDQATGQPRPLAPQIGTEQLPQAGPDQAPAAATLEIDFQTSGVGAPGVWKSISNEEERINTTVCKESLTEYNQQSKQRGETPNSKSKQAARAALPTYRVLGYIALLKRAGIAYYTAHNLAAQIDEQHGDQAERYLNRWLEIAKYKHNPAGYLVTVLRENAEPPQPSHQRRQNQSRPQQHQKRHQSQRQGQEQLQAIHSTGSRPGAAPTNQPATGIDFSKYTTGKYAYLTRNNSTSAGI